MITGRVTEEGDPVVLISVGGREWPATIDTGFNGDLQLPEACRNSIATTYAGRATWILADNTVVEEDVYLAEITFDGKRAPAIVSFLSAESVLVGTHFLRAHRLTIDFVNATVLLERTDAK